jgi:tetratricopeptide (TPR) repeat protein
MNSSSVSSTSAKQSNALPDDQTIDVNSNTVPLDIYEKIQFLNAEASMYLAQNQFDSAINAFNRLLDFYTASTGENHPAVSSTYHNIGISHSKRASMSDNDEKIEEYNMLAQKAFRKAVHIAEVTMGKNHPSVAVSLVRLGLILLQMGDFEESNSIFQECLKIRKASLGNDHPLVAKVYNNIGVAKLHADKMKEALSAFDSACKIQRCVLEQINISCENRAIAEMELADTLSNICTLCLDLAEKDESVQSNSNLAKKGHSAIEEAINIRKTYCNHDDERIVQAEGLLNDAKILMNKYLQKEEQEESSNASSYDTAVCDTVISCPSDENLFKIPLMNFPSSPSDMNKNIVGSIESASRAQNWSRFHKTGSEVAPLEVSLTSVNSIPDENAFSRDFITLKDTADLEKLSVSRISRDTTSSTTKSHSKIEMHCDQSILSNIDAKTVEFKIFDSPIRQKMKEESPSDFKVSFSQIQDENTFMITSDDAISPFASSPTRSSKSSKWFDEVELAKFPNKYPTQIHELASACLEKGEFDRSLSWFRILLDHYKAEHGELHQNIGATLHNIGIVQMRLEQYDEALLSFQKAVRVRRGSIGRDHADVATSLVKVGVVELLLRRFDSALLTFREALSVRRHALGHLHPSTARIYNNIGCAHAKFDEVREARCAFEAALDVQRNALLYEPENKQLQFAVSTTLSNLAHLYTSRGMYEKASMVLVEALSFQESVFSSDHPLVMSTLDTLADTYANFGDNVKALKCYSDILERTKKKGIRNGKASNRKKRATVLLLYKTSRVYRKQNDFEAALRFLQDSYQCADELGIPELSSRIMNEIDEVQKQLIEVNYDWV